MSAAFGPEDGSGAPAAEPAAGLTPERIDTLLERLAADESRYATTLHLGPVSLPPGRGGALLLAGAGGLVLLAGALLALYVLGTVL